MRIRSAAKTHVGLVRTNNEDSYLCNDAHGLYAVADGMGGHAAGEVASKTALETLARNAWKIRFGGHYRKLLEWLFIKADSAIHQDIAAHPERSGMGTTLTMLSIAPGSSIARVAHVGDSRCYIVRDGIGRQLTQDHAIPGSHVILNCLGDRPGAHVKTDVITEQVRPGDVFILCSDGLSDYIDANEAARLTVKSAARGSDEYLSNPPDFIAGVLVGNALVAGGADNITVVVVAVEE